MALRIMIIEDDPDVLDLYQELLTDAGYDVAPYADPRHAVPDIARIKPALVILDWICSAQELGRGTLRQLQQRPAIYGPKVLVCTAAVHHVQQFEAELIAAGVPVMYKPFHTEDLLAAIRHLLAGEQIAGTR